MLCMCYNMDVTKENFAEVLPEVTAAIEQCSFITFDGEFTGLFDGVRLSWTDLPQERYNKLKQGAARFALMQFGVCLFSEDQAGKYIVTPYNFYLFHGGTDRKLDTIFTCQSASLRLLAAHGMDFNKWIKEGIPYLSEKEEAWCEERTAEGKASSNDPDHCIGFSQLIKTITKAGKPLVGHNCILDMLHMYTHFIGPLPESLGDFKLELHKRFPCVYDTKVVAMESELQSYFLTSSLPDVYERVKGSPFPKLNIELPSNCSHYTSTKTSAHQAAFDAYTTGYCMLAMSKMLGGTNGNLFSPPVREHENRIFLPRCEGILSLHLAGTDPPVSREHVFLMSLPKEMTTDDIRNLFSPFGGARVYWINSTSAHIIMVKEDQAKQALESLSALGEVSGMPFCLSPSHPQSSPHLPSTSGNAHGQQDRKRTLDQETPTQTKAAKLFDDSEPW